MDEPTRMRRGITTGRAAELLGCSRRTVLRALTRGDLPGWRLWRGEWRIALADVLELVRRSAGRS